MLLAGCSHALRALPAPGAPPARLALAAPQPGATHRVLGVDLWVHDSDPAARRPVLLCLHAIGHGGGDFAGLSAALHDWRVIAVDWPGHGRSGADTEKASALRYTQLLEALTAELGLEGQRVVILGNSIGGATAVRYAAAHPERVRGLVLANPGGLDPGASGLLGRLFIGNLVSHFEQGARDEARFEPWYRDWCASILVTPPALPRRERIVAAGYVHAGLLAEAWDSFRQPEASLASLIERVKMPVLFTWADRDALVSWSRNEAAIRRFPRAEVVHFEAGHAAFLEDPEGFMRALLPFLAAVSSGG